MIQVTLIEKLHKNEILIFCLPFMHLKSNQVSACDYEMFGKKLAVSLCLFSVIILLHIFCMYFTQIWVRTGCLDSVHNQAFKNIFKIVEYIVIFIFQVVIFPNA